MTRWLWLVVALGLAGCASAPRDGGPQREVDLAAIPSVEPRVEPISMAGNKSPYSVFGKTYKVMDDSEGYAERGLASWYGSKFHGRLTSNGETYDMYSLTAAHRSLPIPAYVRVENLENGREIIVRVNDRGPFHPDRIIDLSWAAAAKLGFADTGVAPVKVTAIDPADYQVRMAERTRQAEAEEVSQQSPEPLAELGDNAYLQVAALADPDSVDQLLDRLIPLFDQPIEVLDEDTERGRIYRVQVGPIEQRSQLNLMQTMLELGGMQPGFVVRREACTQSC